MTKQKPSTFLLLLIFLSVSALAQKRNSGVIDTLSDIVQMPVPDGRESSSFDSIRQQKQISVRGVPKKIIDSLRAEEDFWYANFERVKKKPLAQPEQTPRKSLFQLGWFRNLLWVIILSSFLGVVFWYLVASNIFIFRKTAKSIIRDDETEGETDDIFALDYEKEIVEAVESGNYRLAVRLWYLHTLKELSNKGVIDYRYGRTNSDYVNQLSKSPYYRDFFRLTRNFEYTWYGQFDLSADAYQMMRNDYLAFKNNLR